MKQAALGCATRLVVVAAAAVLLAIPCVAVASTQKSGSGSSGSGSSGGAGLSGSSSSNSGKASSSRSQHLGQRILREGMRGHDVRVLQDYLSRAGFYTAVDGSFGPATKTSVIAFQRSVHRTPNGVVSYAVARALRRAVAAAASSPPPSGKTRINSNGTATAPANSPAAVVAAVAAANHIIHTSYCYAGGHGSWNDSCYDCSGAVSYVLHGANLLSAPEDSTELESYGRPGPGKWMTIYADPSHTWIVIAGRAFDTADYGGPNVPSGTGPRWRSNPTGNLGDGGHYIVRHPAGL